MSTATVEHKRGDTFLYSAVLKETKTGPVIDIRGWTITSMIRDLDGLLIADLTVSITDGEQGEYTVSADDTAAWPVGWAQWDIQYVDDGNVIKSTETVRVKIVQDVTYPDP